MSPEPFVSRTKASPAYRNEKGYGDENDTYPPSPPLTPQYQPRPQGLSTSRPLIQEENSLGTRLLIVLVFYAFSAAQLACERGAYRNFQLKLPKKTEGSSGGVQ